MLNLNLNLDFYPPKSLTHDRVSTPRLFAILDQAGIDHTLGEDVDTVLVYGQPSVTISMALRGRVLKFTAEVPLEDDWLTVPANLGVQAELEFANRTNALLPMVKAGYVAQPERLLRYQYAARLDAGMSSENLVNALRSFQRVVAESVSTLPGWAGS